MKFITYFICALVISLSAVHHTTLFADSTSEPEKQEMTFFQKVTGFFKGLFTKDTSSEEETQEEQTPKEEVKKSSAQEEQALEEKKQPTEQDKEKAMNSEQKFLEENKSKPDVKVTASGLQYKLLKEGEKKPVATDTVQVHYRGTLINGTEFDSSYKRGEPASFPLKGVIAGWTEGLQYVGEGGKIQLFIPPELGYGSQSVGNIPPNSVLVFEVELLKIL